MRVSWRGRASLAATLVLFGGLLMPAGPAAAAAPVTFERAETGSRCVSGAKPAGGTLTATLLRPDGTRRDRRRDTQGATGWGVCFTVTPRPGDRIRAVRGSIDRTNSRCRP